MTINTSLEKDVFNKILNNLSDSNERHLQIYPGESYKRQPAHVVYGGAQLFNHNLAKKIGERSLKIFNDYAPQPVDFQKVLDISDELAKTVHERVKNKLESEALEDFRIDFEDGYGNRPDSEEDKTAYQTAIEVSIGMKEKSLPPFIGIRIKPLTEEHKKRSLRTLDIFLTTLLNQTEGKLPENFVITLPKINSHHQVEALIQALEALENKHQLSETLKIEIMVEIPETLFDPEGKSSLLKMIKASKGRCFGAHFGTYDFTASMNITASHQSMNHQICDFAKNFMKVALTGTGVFLSDGATNIMPVGPHKGELSKKEKEENIKTVHSAWKLSAEHIGHSLKNGIYQGWDLHPAQLPIRYASLYSFFLSSLDQATARLKKFMDSAAKATLTDDVFDDAATGQGLLNYFLRAQNCGAITSEEIQAAGLTLEEIKLRSFAKILKGRKSI